MTSLGHSGADSSSTASRPVRSASSISPSVRTCSQPAALMWPRNELGYERRWTSPSPIAVASIPPPECTTTWSIAAPSVDANHVERRNRSRPPSANVTPGTVCMRRVPSISRATFSSSGTVNGSSSMGPRQWRPRARPGRASTGCAGTARGRLRDLDRERRRALDLGLVLPRRGGEPPAPAGEDADADARGRRAVDPLHLLVADGEGLGLVGARARVGVVGAGLHGGLDRHLRDVERHSAPPWGTLSGPTARPNRGILPGATDGTLDVPDVAHRDVERPADDARRTRAGATHPMPIERAAAIRSIELAAPPPSSARRSCPMSHYFSNVTVFDGRTVKTKQGVHVAARRDRVGRRRTRGRRGSRAPPPRSTARAARSRPGLIDCHVHLSFDGGADFAGEAGASRRRTPRSRPRATRPVIWSTASRPCATWAASDSSICDVGRGGRRRAHPGPAGPGGRAGAHDHRRPRAQHRAGARGRRAPTPSAARCARRSRAARA